MSYLQDSILEYLRAHPDGADLKTIAEGIGSRKEVLCASIRGPEKFGLVKSEKECKRKIWRAI